LRVKEAKSYASFRERSFRRRGSRFQAIAAARRGNVLDKPAAERQRHHFINL